MNSSPEIILNSTCNSLNFKLVGVTDVYFVFPFWVCENEKHKITCVGFSQKSVQECV